MAGFSPYTNNPNEGSSTVFPSPNHQILSASIHIIGVSILAHCFARRVGGDASTSYTAHSLKDWSWSRLCVLLLFLDSWTFVALSGILINGVGLSYSDSVCSVGIYLCIIFYAASKGLIYMFLAEKVWIVWGAGRTRSRMRSPAYLVCAAVILGFTAIVILMIVGRIGAIRSDGTCIIGLKPFASIPLLSYDLFVNVFLTSMFLWPLYRKNDLSPRLRRVALNTLLSALIALTTSSVNMCILTILHGKQLGWVCLGSCSTDVTINAVVLLWVTNGRDRDNTDRIPVVRAGHPGGNIVVTKTTSVVTQISSPPPPKRDRNAIPGNVEHGSTVLDLIYASRSPDFKNGIVSQGGEDHPSQWHKRCLAEGEACGPGCDVKVAGLFDSEPRTPEQER